MATERTTVFTDGACSGNPGPGGWAWAVPRGRWRNGAEAQSTNQRMEVWAVLDAVRTIDGPLEVVSDSTYVVNCFNAAKPWWEGWLARGWKNSQKQPVANRDLWEPLIDAYRADPSRIAFRWVKGHSGDPMNDLVDRLAVKACVEQRGDEGDGPPDPAAAGPTDAVADKVDAITGTPVLVAGLRALALGGYEANATADRVRTKLAEVLAAKAKVDPDLVVVSGMGLGAERLGVEAALEAGVPFVAVLAFPAIEATWSDDAKARHRDLIGRAREVVTVGRKVPDSKQSWGAAMARRDAWLARRVQQAVVVWDEEEPNIGRLVRSLNDHLGEDEVWIVEPPA